MTDDAVIQAARAAWEASPRRVLAALAAIPPVLVAVWVLVSVAILVGTPR